MEFLINESQLKLILEKHRENSLSNNMKELHSFTSDVIDKSEKYFNLNLKFYLSFGAAIGGLLLPIDAFLRTDQFKLSDKEITLILIGIISELFYENHRTSTTIYEEIDIERLQSMFKIMVAKTNSLKDAFFRFLESSGVTTKSIIGMISYTFLIPIIANILNMANNNDDIESTSKLITARLLDSGVIVISEEILSDVIKKILNSHT